MLAYNLNMDFKRIERLLFSVTNAYDKSLESGAGEDTYLAANIVSEFDASDYGVEGGLPLLSLLVKEYLAISGFYSKASEEMKLLLRIAARNHLLGLKNLITIATKVQRVV